MDSNVQIEQLQAQVSALEDLLVVALALALKSTPEPYREMMGMWLPSISRVSLATFNATAGWDLDDDDEEGEPSSTSEVIVPLAVWLMLPFGRPKFG